MNNETKPMTKDEIFNKHSWAALGAISPSKYFCLPAMDEYAEIEAIGFAEWKEMYGWWADQYDDNDVKFDSIRWSNYSPSYQYITTKELYQLYKKQQP